MFQAIGDKLHGVFKKLKGTVRLSEKEIDEALKEIKLALLAADVNFKVVKSFLARIREKAMGQDLHLKLTPGQQIISIVHQELVALLGGETVDLNIQPKGITVVLMAGLQGSGKTTSSAKLATYARKKFNKKPLLVACDVYRPAAIKQLQVLGKELDIPVFSMGSDINPVEIARASLSYAETQGLNLVILDTAGRLHLDEELMEEIKKIRETTEPHEILLVVDSMTGQDAVKVTQSFNETLEITGVILTKLDGDARGGAALSIKEVSGKPIKFVGLGEKTGEFEVFHPDRLAQRILGMGDVLTLIEKANEVMDMESALSMQEKMLKASFDFNDFLDQMGKIKKMGPLGDLLKMIPGVSRIPGMADLEVNDKEVGRMTAIITSMTQKERKNPDSIDVSRRRRIAEGSGNQLADVNKLIRDFLEMRKMMKQFSGGKMPNMSKFIPPGMKF